MMTVIEQKKTQKNFADGNKMASYILIAVTFHQVFNCSGLLHSS